MSGSSITRFIPFQGTGHKLNGEPPSQGSASLPSAIHTVQGQTISGLIKANQNPTTALTHTEALRILNQIRWKSEVKAFFTHPVVVLIGAFVVLVAAHLIPLTHIALVTVSLALRMICGALIGAGIGMCVAGGYETLASTSNGHAYHAKLASQEIELLEPKGPCQIQLTIREEQRYYGE